MNNEITIKAIEESIAQKRAMANKIAETARYLGWAGEERALDRVSDLECEIQELERKLKMLEGE